MSSNYISVNNLKVSSILLSFVNEELLKDIDISSEKFWLGFDKIVHELAPKNKQLIKERENLQNILSIIMYSNNCNHYIKSVYYCYLIMLVK